MVGNFHDRQFSQDKVFEFLLTISFGEKIYVFLTWVVVWMPLSKKQHHRNLMNKLTRCWFACVSRYGQLVQKKWRRLLVSESATRHIQLLSSSKLLISFFTVFILYTFCTFYVCIIFPLLLLYFNQFYFSNA